MAIGGWRWCFVGAVLLAVPALAQQFTGRAEVGDSLPQHAVSADFSSTQMAGESLAGPDSVGGTYSGASGPDPRDFAPPARLPLIFADGFEG